MKKVLTFFSVLLFSFSAFSAELAYQLGFSPSLLVNTLPKTESAVSPVVYNVDFDLEMKIKPSCTFRASAGFFSYYSLWTGSFAAPSEIENRTGTVLAFLTKFTWEYNWTLKEKHFIETGAGPAILARYALLSNNVNSSDYGITGTAQSDLEEINRWFWKDLNFLYANLHLTYLYRFNEKISLGPELSINIPAGSFLENAPMNGTLICLGLKARF